MIGQSRQKAILFADISGSSALYKNEGNQLAKEIVDSLLDSMRQLVVSNKGKVVKNIGDEIMTRFNHCDDCIAAACELQLSFSKILQQHQLTLSIGIGFGDVICEKDDLFGEAVNDAAYLTHLAKGGQILLTESVYQKLDEYARINVREFDRITIKGALQASLIYRIFWQLDQVSDKETKLMSSDLLSDELKSLILTIEYKQQRFVINWQETPFTIGRDEAKCDLIVNGDQVSREHCLISFSRGKFVLTDQSTNGCYVSQQNKNEFYLRREEYPLIGSTVVSLGLPLLKAKTEAIKLLI